MAPGFFKPKPDPRSECSASALAKTSAPSQISKPAYTEETLRQEGFTLLANNIASCKDCSLRWINDHNKSPTLTDWHYNNAPTCLALKAAFESDQGCGDNEPYTERELNAAGLYLMENNQVRCRHCTCAFNAKRRCPSLLGWHIGRSPNCLSVKHAQAHEYHQRQLAALLGYPESEAPPLEHPDPNKHGSLSLSEASPPSYSEKL